MKTFAVGDEVYVGYAQERSQGCPGCFVFGPLTVLQVVQVPDENGPLCVRPKITYEQNRKRYYVSGHANVKATFYSPDSMFSTLREALDHASAEFLRLEQEGRI